MRISVYFFFLFLFSFPSSVFADTDYDIGTAIGLYQVCDNIIMAEENKPYDERAYGLCFGYFRGVKDSYEVRAKTGARGNICTTKTSTWLDYIKAFMQWFKRHPEEARNLAWTAVINSMSETWPCPR